MAIGDGQAWDESNPQQSTLANTIDSYERDIRIGVRSRMQQEHVWPASQIGIAAAGYHTYITFAAQGAPPILPVPTGTATQVGALFVTAGALAFENSAGGVTVLVNSNQTSVNISSGIYSATGTQGDVLIGASGGALRVLAASADGYVLVTHTNTAAPTFVAPGLFGNTIGVDIADYGTATGSGTAKSLSNLKIRYGQVTIPGSSSQAISGLPFTDATTYRIVVSQVDGPFNESPSAVNNTGAQFTISNNHNDSRAFQWIALGT